MKDVVQRSGKQTWSSEISEPPPPVRSRDLGDSESERKGRVGLARSLLPIPALCLLPLSHVNHLQTRPIYSYSAVSRHFDLQRIAQLA